MTGTDGGLVLIGYGGEVIYAQRSPVTGALTTWTRIPDTATSHIGFATVASTTHVDGNEIVLIGDAGEDGVTSFRVEGGTLVVADTEGPAEGGGIMNPTDIQTVDLLGRSFAIIASANGAGGALSVVEIGSDGTMTRTDTLNDSLHTRFGGVTKIAVSEVGGRVYVAAAGGDDDGVTLFALIPDGRLQYLAAIANTWTDGRAGQAALTDPSALEMVAGDGKLHIFAASEDVPGVTHLSYDITGSGGSLRAEPEGQQLVGTTGGDVIAGGRGADVIEGGDGDDIIADGFGQDHLTGGAGRDIFVLSGDSDTDTITDFKVGRDRLDLASWPFFYDPASLTITPTLDGAEVVWRGATLVIRTKDAASLTPDVVQAAIILGPSRALDLSGYSFPAVAPAADYDITDTDGSDIIEGSADAERIRIGAGNDEVRAGAGADQVAGGMGVNRVTLGVGDDLFDDLGEGAGDDGDTVFGDGGNDTLRLGAGADFVDGGSGRDLIHAGAGDDVVSGGAGADEAWLGTGNDSYSDDGRDAASEGNVVHGEAGDDRITGGAGSDTLTGGTGNDLLSGQDGDDHIDAGLGNDSIHGDDGDDWIHGEAGFDTIFGGGGDDYIRAGMGDDHVFGGTGADEIFGNAMDDTLHGGEGDDTLRGGHGDDRLFGDAGADQMFGQDGTDTLSGGAGDDWMAGGAGDDTLAGDEGDDTLIGGGGQDDLTGGDGADRLFGFDGDDVLTGGTGNDLLSGGLGADRLWGGSGADRFVFSAKDGQDAVVDFSAEDRLVLRGLAASDITIRQSSGDTEISWDGGLVTLAGFAGTAFDTGDIHFI